VGITAGLAPFLPRSSSWAPSPRRWPEHPDHPRGDDPVHVPGHRPNALLFGAGRGDRLAQIGLITLILTEVGQILAVLAGAASCTGILQTAGLALGLVIRRLPPPGSPALPAPWRFRARSSGADPFRGLQATIASERVRLPVGRPHHRHHPSRVTGRPYKSPQHPNLSRNLSTIGTNLLLHLHPLRDNGRPPPAGRLLLRSVLVSLVYPCDRDRPRAFGEPILQLWLGSVAPKTYEMSRPRNRDRHPAARTPVLASSSRVGARLAGQAGPIGRC